MSQTESDTISLEPISPTKDKLKRRLENIPITDNFSAEEKTLCKEVLLELPEDVVALLDEDALTKPAEIEIADSLRVALYRLAHNEYSIRTDERQIVIAGDSHPLFKTMLMNATARGDCSYQVYQDAGWSLAIPRKFSESAIVPSVALPKPPAPAV